MKINKMIQGKWKIQSSISSLKGVEVKDVPTSQENLNALLKLASSKKIPAKMRLGLAYKCQHMIDNLELNKEFFDVTPEETEKLNIKKKWRELK
jgi:hypothetical protein